MTKNIKKQPNSLTFKKKHRGTFKPLKFNYCPLDRSIVIFEIKTLSAGIAKWKTIDLFFQTLKRKFGKKSKVCVNLQLNWSFSKKPKGVRMGKGKGKVTSDCWVCRVYAGMSIVRIKTLFKKNKLTRLQRCLRFFNIPCSIRLRGVSV